MIKEKIKHENATVIGTYRLQGESLQVEVRLIKQTITDVFNISVSRFAVVNKPFLKWASVNLHPGL